jgi:hypothetical protein
MLDFTVGTTFIVTYARKLETNSEPIESAS